MARLFVPAGGASHDRSGLTFWPPAPVYTALIGMGLPSWTPWLLTELRQIRGQGAFGITQGLTVSAAPQVGYKNGTDGSVQTAIDAMKSSRTPHSFLGIDQDGATSIIKTTGNPDSHVVLRGGREGTNYEPYQVAAVCDALRKSGLRPMLMVDCSHANSGKDPHRQPHVWQSIIDQRASGRREIIGAMLESHLNFGGQSLGNNPVALKYGVSITDACMDWQTTRELLSGFRV